MTEEWRDIVGYESLYQVSDLGNVRSLDRIRTWRSRHGTLATRKYEGCLLKIQRCSNGYMFVALSKNGIVKQHLIHRLVAAAFIGDSSLEVNHKDGDKENNSLSNLEYMTHSENQKHSYRVLNTPPVRSWLGKRGFEHDKSIPVAVVDTVNGTKQVFGSYRIAEENGFSRNKIREIIDKSVLYKNRYRFESIV